MPKIYAAPEGKRFDSLGLKMLFDRELDFKPEYHTENGGNRLVIDEKVPRKLSAIRTLMIKKGYSVTVPEK